MSDKSGVNGSLDVVEHVTEHVSVADSSENFKVSSLTTYSRAQLVGCIKGLLESGKISGEDVVETSESSKGVNEEYFGERFTSSSAW